MAAVVDVVVDRGFSSASICVVLFGGSASPMSVGLISEALGHAKLRPAVTGGDELPNLPTWQLTH